LLLADGQEVRGVLHDGDPDLLQQYFGREITIFGKAVYRPSGTLLRIDAQEILDTVEGRSAFSVVPPALTHRPKLDRKVQTAKNGVAAFFGSWPGDETDDELLAALARGVEALSPTHVPELRFGYEHPSKFDPGP
jgi:hypothetical protein